MEFCCGINCHQQINSQWLTTQANLYAADMSLCTHALINIPQYGKTDEAKTEQL